MLTGHIVVPELGISISLETEAMMLRRLFVLS
jgi:hypothetical protein